MSVVLKIGQKVEVTGKGVQGEIAYIGTTAFQTGKWIGIILDEPKGKNNGTVQNKSYFQCKENHGMFVRQTQLTLITESGSRIDLSTSGSTSVTSPDDSTRTPKSRLTSSRQSLGGRSKESMSREDMTSSTSSLASTTDSTKKSSFIERTPTSVKTGIPKSTPRRPVKTLIPSTKQSSKERETPTEDLSVQEADGSQTGFVETLKPQFTPGQVTVGLSHGGTPRTVSTSEINQDNETIKDLIEKLETMRIKYKEKVHELESVNLQLDQSAEFKAKIMEAQANLKKELERVKQEKDDAIEAKEELSDLADTLELATLDKEMAEEKAESLQKELEQAQERIEELEMELEIVKSELADKMEGVDAQLIQGADGEQMTFKMKQIVQQNDKLKDTLVRLRDLSAHEKHEKQKLLKEFEEKKIDFEQVLKANEKLKNKIQEMEGQLDELQSYVDAALGAEEMVETLGQQKLTLEEAVKELQEAVAELEELQDVNDQLQEGFREQEQDFRQELDSKNLQVWEAQRKTESVLESLADRELTIVKFRELVQRIQEENQELRSQLEMTSKSSSLSSSLLPEMLDFKKMFAETKAHARAIELELRHMEINQAQKHVEYLVSFMPDSFLVRGGDNDAIMLVLLMPRLLAKSQVLVSRLRDKFPPVTNIDKTSVIAAQQYAAMSRFSAQAHMLQGILHQFVHSLNTCKPETLLKASSSYPDMAQQERSLDAYIEMLKKERVDENINSDILEKIVAYFNTIHPTLLLSSGDCSIHQGQLLADMGKAVLCLIDSMKSDIGVIKSLLPEGEGLETLLKIQPQLDGLRNQLRQVRRRAEFPDLLLGENPDFSVVTKAMVMLSNVLAMTTARLVVLPSDSDNPVPNSKLAELLKLSFEKNYDIIGDKERTVHSFIESSMETVVTSVATTVKDLQDNEDKYLTLKSDKESVEPPLIVRARKVKDELNAIAGVKKRMESKEEDLRELKLNLRAKQEELAEMTVRKDIAEKKLANATRDHELTIETLKRKLEESYQQSKRKEKEFEETMDHLQRDIDSLEMEKGELKDKLKMLPKKAQMDMMANSTTSLSGDMSYVSDGSGSGPVKIVESPILLNEIKHLRNLVKTERKARLSEQTKKYLDVLNRLAPIPMPNKTHDEGVKRIAELKKKLKDLENEYIQSLPTLVDLSGVKYGHWGTHIKSHIVRTELAQKDLKEKTIALQNEITLEYLKQKKGGHKASDFTIFPSPELVKTMNETEQPELEISFVTSDEKLQGKTINLSVDMNTFTEIRSKLYELSSLN